MDGPGDHSKSSTCSIFSPMRLIGERGVVRLRHDSPLEPRPLIRERSRLGFLGEHKPGEVLEVPSMEGEGLNGRSRRYSGQEVAKEDKDLREGAKACRQVLLETGQGGALGPAQV